jgi:hypothetical protein
MKEVRYSPALQEREKLYALARQATERLDELLGPPARRAQAEWDLGRGRQGDVVLLKLSDTGGVPADSATAVFDPGEMNNQPPFDGRLLLLWGNVLKARSDRQIRDMLDGNGQGG